MEKEPTEQTKVKRKRKLSGFKKGKRRKVTDSRAYERWFASFCG